VNWGWSRQQQQWSRQQQAGSSSKKVADSSQLAPHPGKQQHLCCASDPHNIPNHSPITQPGHAIVLGNVKIKGNVCVTSNVFVKGDIIVEVRLDGGPLWVQVVSLRGWGLGAGIPGTTDRCSTAAADGGRQQGHPAAPLLTAPPSRADPRARPTYQTNRARSRPAGSSAAGGRKTSARCRPARDGTLNP